MPEVSIKVDNVSKSFKLPHEKHGSIKSLLINMSGRGKKYEKQEVLKNISLEINKGEFFGIVGRNGSGKSTLLKLLAGVYSPNKGHIQINGKLTPFIELGVGFNPELSGRDNVFLNGALLGFSKKDMESMYDDIVEFAELEKFMDQKLKNYSSGMQVRLAFSIAIRVQSDILLLDEVLAVGDEAFQQKCLRVFEEYRRTGQTVVLVTHDMGTVRNLCTRALLINDGKIAMIGSVESVAEQYSELNTDKGSAPKIIQNDFTKTKSKAFSVKALNNKKVYKPSEQLKLEISLLGSRVDKDTILGVAIVGLDGTYIFGSNTNGLAITGKKIQHTVKLDLGPGQYSTNVATLDSNGKVLELNEGVFRFRIIDDGRKDVGGEVRLDFVYEQN